MSSKRKKPSRDPRRGGHDVIVAAPGATVPSRPYPPGPHPGSDVITVVYPKKPSDEVLAGLGDDVSDTDLAAFTSALEMTSEDVTRDEFTRRLAGSDVVRQVNADPLNRVVGLMEVDAVIRWWDTAGDS